MEDKLFEEFNNITFDEAEIYSIEDSLTEVEIRKLKKNLKKSIYKTNKKQLRIAASIAIIAIVGITFVTPAFAQTVGQNIPMLDTIYEKLGYYEEFKDFSQYIGMTKEDKGYKFTIDKLVADNDTVLVALRVSKPGMNSNPKADHDADFLMSADLTGTMKGTILSGGVDVSILDENTSLVLLENDTAPEKSLPKRFNMIVNIHSSNDENVNVNFNLPVSEENIQKETIVKKDIGESIVGDNINVKLKQIKISPINTSIKYTTSKDTDYKNLINFYVYDDKGRIYIQNGGRADDSGYKMYTLNKIEDDANKLYIVPYLEVFENIKDNDSEPYSRNCSLDFKGELELRDGGKIEIYKTEKNKNSIKIYYSLKGVQNSLNKNHIISLHDEKLDKQAYVTGPSIRNMKLYKTDLNNPDNYCAEFYDIDTSKNYYYNVYLFYYSKVIEGKPIEVKIR